MDNPFIKLIGQIIPVSPQLANDFNARLITRFLHKREVLLKEGQVCGHIYFIAKGLLRAYCTGGGAECTNWLLWEGELATSLRSFHYQLPSSEYIEALEDTEVLSLSFDDLMQLYANHPELNTAARIITTHYYCLIEELYISVRKDTATERYRRLLQHSPELIKRVQSQHIATYLGMNLATLSRIKRRLLSKRR